ncbi:hypothetical protein CTEN210_09913 [Chaetoceros tenuissimus]|uniref:GP-PDE domain-containing protein n=1 Tax=Chaetoceros tenuissimus TaxID=426638 RepID=A0AAD3CWQ4_9STRA|nr:hypothetical protein CTEN210_09913 [Chaetoceros tenuissimus]
MKRFIGSLLLSAQSISIVAFSSTSRGISNKANNCRSSWLVKGENVRPIAAKNLSSFSAKYPSLSNRIKSSLLVTSLPLEEIIEIIEHDAIPTSSNEKDEDSKDAFAKSLVTHLQIDNIASSSDMTPLQKHIPTIVGHRGSLYRSLENTRHSFRVAAEHCSEIECDVFLLKCGTLCVFHGGGNDENPGCLKDYCNMDASILDLTYEQARNLRFNKGHLEFGCGPDFIEDLEHECYIPTLEEVLHDAKETGVTVKCELKGPATEEPVLELVEKLNMVDRVHYSSFNHSRIKRIRELRPERNEDTENFLDLALEAGASEVHLKYSTCTPDKVDRIHNAGLDSMIWMRGPIGMMHDVSTLFHDVGNEDESMYMAIMRTGVKKMCVNRPDVLHNLLSKHGTPVITN